MRGAVLRLHGCVGEEGHRYSASDGLLRRRGLRDIAVLAADAGLGRREPAPHKLSDRVARCAAVGPVVHPIVSALRLVSRATRCRDDRERRS